MVVDIGGGTTEVGVISLGGMVTKGQRARGWRQIRQSIINYIRRNYGMLIGEPTAEAIKKASARLSRLEVRKWKSRAATFQAKACHAASPSRPTKS